VESFPFVCGSLGVDVDDLYPGQRRGVDESTSRRIDDEDLTVRGKHIIDELLTASGRVHKHQRRPRERTPALPEQELRPILQQDAHVRRLSASEVRGEEPA